MEKRKKKKKIVNIILLVTGTEYTLSSNLIIVQQDATVFSLLYFCRQRYMFQVLTPETCRAAYRNITKWIQTHLVGQLLNLIHDAQTHEYKIHCHHRNMKMRKKRIQIVTSATSSTTYQSMLHKIHYSDFMSFSKCLQQGDCNKS